MKMGYIFIAKQLVVCGAIFALAIGVIAGAVLWNHHPRAFKISDYEAYAYKCSALSHYQSCKKPIKSSLNCIIPDFVENAEPRHEITPQEKELAQEFCDIVPAWIDLDDRIEIVNQGDYTIKIYPVPNNNSFYEFNAIVEEKDGNIITDVYGSAIERNMPAASLVNSLFRNLENKGVFK